MRALLRKPAISAFSFTALRLHAQGPGCAGQLRHSLVSNCLKVMSEQLESLPAGHGPPGLALLLAVGALFLALPAAASDPEAPHACEPCGASGGCGAGDASCPPLTWPFPSTPGYTAGMAPLGRGVDYVGGGERGCRLRGGIGATRLPPGLPASR